MSLLDTGPHIVVVTPQVKTANAYGGWDLTNGTPVTVAGVMVQNSTTDELVALGGYQAGTFRRVIGRGPWPGGIKSTVTFRGRTWDQIGEADDYSVGQLTKHFSVMIRARTAEVK